MATTIQIRGRGEITLPLPLREKYNIKRGSIFKLIDLNGIFVFVPITPMVPELAREIERIRIDTGVTIDELMQGLRKEREKYNQEKYGE